MAMKINRRKVLAGMAGGLTVPLGRPAIAQANWPGSVWRTEMM